MGAPVGTWRGFWTDSVGGEMPGLSGQQETRSPRSEHGHRGSPNPCRGQQTCQKTSALEGTCICYVLCVYECLSFIFKL